MGCGARQRGSGQHSHRVVVMPKKRCIRCKKLKALTGFHKGKNPDGLKNVCRKCRSDQEKVRYLRNRSSIIDRACRYQKGYYAKNKQRINLRNKKYEQTRKQQRNTRRAWRRKHDLNYRLTVCLRARLQSLINGTTKSDRTLNLLGCSVERLKQHLESKFRNGMSWSNYGFRGWHMDHIKPCTAFDLTRPDQQRQCFHFTNLQPLWGLENISKGGIRTKNCLIYKANL